MDAENGVWVDFDEEEEEGWKRMKIMELKESILGKFPESTRI